MKHSTKFRKLIANLGIFNGYVKLNYIIQLDSSLVHSIQISFSQVQFFSTQTFFYSLAHTTSCSLDPPNLSNHPKSPPQCQICWKSDIVDFDTPSLKITQLKPGLSPSTYIQPFQPSTFNVTLIILNLLKVILLNGFLTLVLYVT